MTLYEEYNPSFKVFVVCHTDFGYITHSYITAINLEYTTQEAAQKFVNIKSVMQLNKG